MPIYKISEKKSKEYRGQLLAWYDKNRRTLPWRYLSGEVPNPYYVWMSEIMLQQTTVTAVKPYFERFTALWPNIKALAAADRDEIMREWAGLGYYARARNLHDCAQMIVREHKGQFPTTQKQLKSLPGIGDYTSAAIMAIAFNKPATVVDGNIERVMSRLSAVREPLPKSKMLLKNLAAQLFDLEVGRPGDLAQGLMDLGATICTPKSPQCPTCPLSADCRAYRQGNPVEFPYKEARKAKPQKVGYVYWVTNENEQILLHKRPDKGLLGGMIGLPTSEWINKENNNKINCLNKFINLKNKESVHHSFTHFDLELIVKMGAIRNDCALESEYIWEEKVNLPQIGFPSLFQKVVRLINI